MPLEKNPLPASANVVDLDWYAEGDLVRVTPRNQARFEVQKDHAIEVLRVAAKQKVFGNQMELLLQQLAKWISERSTEISDAVLTMQDANLFFVVVRTASEFDEDFEESLAELDLGIAQDSALSLIRISTFSLPHVSEDALGSFIDPRFMARFHGQGS